MIPANEMENSIAAPVSTDQRSIQRLAYEFMEHFILPRRERPEEVIRILNKDVLPFWADRDSRTITQREVVTRLDQIVSRGAGVMANRTANILSSMFKFGIHRALVEHSPVQLLFRPGGDEPPRTRVLNECELKALLCNLKRVCEGTNRAPIHFILLLTLQRRSALALAEWSEIDLTGGVWSIPAEHDKMRRAHQVPLSAWVSREFESLRLLSQNATYVLPNRHGTMAANPQLISRGTNRLQSKLKEYGIGKFTTHDIRRTGRTFLAKLGVSAEVAERILNHQKDQIEATYNLYDYAKEKRTALEQWEQYLTRLAHP